MSRKRPKTEYTYDCGVKAGQKVRLKHTVHLEAIGQVHLPGEVWTVVRGFWKRPRRLIRLQRPDGGPHLWTGETFWDTFEAI
jgi:hypothetical protein